MGDEAKFKFFCDKLDKCLKDVDLVDDSFLIHDLHTKVPGAPKLNPYHIHTEPVNTVRHILNDKIEVKPMLCDKVDKKIKKRKF